MTPKDGKWKPGKTRSVHTVARFRALRALRALPSGPGLSLPPDTAGSTAIFCGPAIDECSPLILGEISVFSTDIDATTDMNIRNVMHILEKAVIRPIRVFYIDFLKNPCM